MQDKALLVSCPSPFVILHTELDVLGFFYLSEYIKKHGRAKSLMMQLERIEGLNFSNKPTNHAFIREKDELGNASVAITGKGLYTLVIMSILKKSKPSFTPKDIANFLDGQALNEALDWQDSTLPLIYQPDQYPTLPDDPHRFAAATERRLNWDMWKRLGVIEDD